MFKIRKIVGRYVLLGLLCMSLVMMLVNQAKASNGISSFFCNSVCIERSPGEYEVCDEEVVWNGWYYTCSTDESLCEVVAGCNYDPTNGNGSEPGGKKRGGPLL